MMNLQTRRIRIEVTFETTEWPVEIRVANPRQVRESMCLFRPLMLLRRTAPDPLRAQAGRCVLQLDPSL